MRYVTFLLATCTATAAVAQNLPSNKPPPPPQIVLCKLVQDSDMRLNCYDNAVSALTSQPLPVPPTAKQQSWDIAEETDSIIATLIGANDTATMVISCRANRTSVSVFLRDDIRATTNQTRVVYQIEKGKQIEEQWRIAADAKSATPPKPIGFIRSLPDSGVMSIQVLADADVLASDIFELGDVSSVKTKLGSRCSWPDETASTVQKRIPLPRSSPIRNQENVEKQSTLPSWLSNILK